MGRIIIFLGTPGAGKSSILKGINQDNLRIINVGTEMFEIARKQYSVEDRDDVRHLAPEITDKISEIVFAQIVSQKEDVIIDTHASVRSGPRFYPGFTVEKLQKLKGLKTIVYVDASSRDILARRSKDLTRRRDVEDETDLEEQREVNLSFIGTYSVTMGLPIYIIKNNEGHLKQAIEQANKIVSETFT
ncbi:MAG: AAA family ATPase [Candidatus Micrarchaeota archaeon]|nr:AAA family ATPase [Candidatus Micrarchaeota archaeon]